MSASEIRCTECGKLTPDSPLPVKATRTGYVLERVPSLGDICRCADASQQPITLQEAIDSYPGGLPALSRATGVPDTTLRSVRATTHRKMPYAQLRKLARAADWGAVRGAPQETDATSPSLEYARRQVVDLRFEWLRGLFLTARAARANREADRMRRRFSRGGRR